MADDERHVDQRESENAAGRFYGQNVHSLLDERLTPSHKDDRDDRERDAQAEQAARKKRVGRDARVPQRHRDRSRDDDDAERVSNAPNGRSHHAHCASMRVSPSRRTWRRA